MAASSGVVQVPRLPSAELEELVASLRVSNAELEARLQRTEGELADLRSAAKGRPEQAAFAAVAPTPMVVLPSETQGAATVALRFSSIPPALRTGRRKAVRWAISGGLLFLVAIFVAITVLSRAH
jgi:hypothetical protein